MASLDQVHHSLDMSAINRAVDLLTQAKKIAFLAGLFGRRRPRRDEQVFRFNVPVIYSDDIVLQRMSCMNCNDDDVVVIISHTGRTKSLVELAQLARENDAMVIAITSPARRFPGNQRWRLPRTYRKIPISICRWSPA